MENKNTTDETFNTVVEPHNHRAIIGFDKNGIPKVLVPVSGHTHKLIDENGNEYEHSHEEVFTEDYRKAVSAYRKTFPTKQDVLDNVPDPAVKEMMLRMEQLGYDNVFIGTVEGEPEDTSCEAVIEKLKEAGYKKVILRPLMVVAGDHANNDMAGDDDDSWKSQFEASGAFDSIDTQIAGLGEIQAIQQLYVAHTQAAIDAE